MRLIAFWRALRTPPAHTERLLASLISPFKRAGRIFMRIVDVERRAATYETVAEHADIGVLLVSIKGKVQLCNAVARKMLTQTEALEIRADRLLALDKAAHRVLMEQIARAIEGQKAGSEHISMPSAMGATGEPDALTAIVYPGPRYKPARGPIRCSAIILLRDSARVPRIPAEHVGRLFHLTPAEALLATRIAGGSSLTEIAASRGVKHNTLRSQLQTIFAKTGVKRQSELVRLICTSTAALS